MTSLETRINGATTTIIIRNKNAHHVRFNRDMLVMHQDVRMEDLRVDQKEDLRQGRKAVQKLDLIIKLKVEHREDRVEDLKVGKKVELITKGKKAISRMLENQKPRVQNPEGQM
jgi:hypothetical protein